MRYIIFELRKLAGFHYILIFAAVLFLSNIVLASHTASRQSERQIPSYIVIDFFNLYIAEPAAVEAEYADLLERINERNRLSIEAIRQGDFDFELEPLPNRFLDIENFADIDLFNELFIRIDRIRAYPATIQRVINSAHSNLREFDTMGISSNDFRYQYQLRVIDLYERAKSGVRMGLEYTRGWESYFKYDFVNIFIFAILVMIGSIIFAQEKHSGFVMIMRTAKNGRLKTAAAKIGAMLIVTFLVTLIFKLSTLSIFGVFLGFSNINNAIQIFEHFIFSHIIITIGQYLIINFAIQFLSFALFLCVVTLFSVLFHSYVITYTLGLGLFGVNFLMYATRFLDANNPLRHLNLIAIAAVEPLFVRYRAINFLGNSVGYIPFMLIMYCLLLIATSTATVVIFAKSHTNTITSKRFDLLTNAKNILTNALKPFPKISFRRRIYSRSLFCTETYKTLVLKRYLFIIVGILLVRCYIATDNFRNVNTFFDSIKREYMTMFEGALTDEKREFIRDYRATINHIIEKSGEMRERYVAGDIDWAEYRVFLGNYGKARSRNDAFRIVVEEHLMYIEMTAIQKNIDIWFMYDTGWRLLFHRGFDIILYVLLLLLFSGSFADEYTSKSSSGSFAQILRTTKNGRRHTFRAKLISAITIALSLTLIFNAIDLTIIFRNWELPAINAPLLSLQSFADINSSITVGQYLVTHILIRLLANILFTLFVCGLSAILKKTILVMSISVAVTLFPALFVYFGLYIFNYFDFTGLLSGTQLYLLSARTNLIGDTGFFVLFMILCTVISLAILFKAEKDYIK